MILALLACGIKSSPIPNSAPLPVEVIISDNRWEKDGLFVQIGVRSAFGEPKLTKVVLLHSFEEYRMDYIHHPTVGNDWFNTQFFIPMEEETGQLINGNVYIWGRETPVPFSFVTPFAHEDHDDHND